MMQFIKKRKEYGNPPKFSDTEANEKTTDIKQGNDPYNHKINKVIDIGV